MEARNSNYATICRQLTFSRRAWYAEEEAAAAAAATATPALAASKSKGPQGHYLGAAVFDDAAGQLDGLPLSCAGGGYFVFGEGGRGACLPAWWRPMC